MSEETKPEEQSKKIVEPIRTYVKPKRNKFKDKIIKETKPQGQPKQDEKMGSIDDAIKKQQERFKGKEVKKEGEPVIINTSVYDKLKKDISETPFVGGSGMWKAVTTAYNSCTDEFGKLTTTIDKLQEKVSSAQRVYFEKHFGKWQTGDQKDRGATIGDTVYRQYLGDAREAFKPLEKRAKEELTHQAIMSQALEPLVEHYTKQISALDQYRIQSLKKEDKERLKDELVERSKAIGRPLAKVDMMSDQALVRAVYGVFVEEKKKGYESTTKDKPLLDMGYD